MNKIPKTIEELKIAYVEKNLPNEETTRFFIDKDYKYPRAFGIYKDEVTGNFVVYKNKADGTRAIRYEGPDEAFAVKELYTRLEQEVINQKSNTSRSYTTTRLPASKQAKDTIIAIVIFTFICVFTMMIAFFSVNSPRRGYYIYNDNCYYYQNGSWYEYNNSWGRDYSVPSDLKKNHKDYYRTQYYYSTYNASDFSDTIYYKEDTSSSYDSSTDYGSSWDSSDSWDSSSTDWDSDW